MNLQQAPSTLYTLSLLLIGAVLAVFGGFFGVILRMRYERKAEINFIKVCLIDELTSMISIIYDLNKTYEASKTIYSSYLNELLSNTSNFNDHKRRIYLINDDKLRKDIASFYKELNKIIKESESKVQSLAAATPVSTAEHDGIIIKIKKLSTDADRLKIQLGLYKYKALWLV